MECVYDGNVSNFASLDTEGQYGWRLSGVEVSNTVGQFALNRVSEAMCVPVVPLVNCNNLKREAVYVNNKYFCGLCCANHQHCQRV